jgi:hypothetical protein
MAVARVSEAVSPRLPLVAPRGLSRPGVRLKMRPLTARQSCFRVSLTRECAGVWRVCARGGGSEPCSAGPAVSRCRQSSTICRDSGAACLDVLSAAAAAARVATCSRLFTGCCSTRSLASSARPRKTQAALAAARRSALAPVTMLLRGYYGGQRPVTAPADFQRGDPRPLGPPVTFGPNGEARLGCLAFHLASRLACCCFLVLPCVGVDAASGALGV